MRIGHGYDVHKFDKDRPLFLGGVEIPFEMGLLGHSDADVVLHAAMDSILGALAKGDIGKIFPDSDDRYLNIDSKLLLKQVAVILKGEGYALSNMDITIIAQVPKLSPYITQMRKTIASILNTDIKNISVKATTEEKMGFTGRKEGISCHAVCLIEKKAALKSL